MIRFSSITACRKYVVAKYTVAIYWCQYTTTLEILLFRSHMHSSATAMIIGVLTVVVFIWSQCPTFKTPTTPEATCTLWIWNPRKIGSSPFNTSLCCSVCGMAWCPDIENVKLPVPTRTVISPVLPVSLGFGVKCRMYVPLTAPYLYVG